MGFFVPAIFFNFSGVIFFQDPKNDLIKKFFGIARTKKTRRIFRNWLKSHNDDSEKNPGKNFVKVSYVEILINNFLIIFDNLKKCEKLKKWAFFRDR